MLSWFKRRKLTSPPSARQASIPADTRVYAIGDIHGRLDLLNELLTLIEDDAQDYTGRKIAVFLGDYIDRGPDSKGVIDRLMQPLPADLEPVYLKGNHEAAMLHFFGSLETGAGWMRYGGLETLRSYNIPMQPGIATPERLTELQRSLQARFPAHHREWLDSCAISYELGDYYFVHAGIRPDVPLTDQSDHDRLWIRDAFLSWRGGGLEKMIVHGHTISRDVEIHPHRIGIDTGAYSSGRLTSIVLEESRCRILQTNPNKN